ncbi:MAG: hypothetical protein OXI60_01730 [Acidiferrobacterales bacterium]|nr:hypothetical protein [Acidiferrobacterales bacterium]
MVWTADRSVQYPYDPAAAIRHFRSVDKALYDLTREIGAYRLELRSDMTPFSALLRSIVYQQLSGHAAKAILDRVLALYDSRFPQPKQLINTTFDQLRACGLSQSKIRAVWDLAQKEEAGLLPTPADVQDMTDSELIDAYTTVRGIGPWTVQMLLIFNLGRSDVLPDNDLGVRRGFKVAFSLDDMPSPEQLRLHGERWNPYRSVASWYLWRAADTKFRSKD